MPRQFCPASLSAGIEPSTSRSHARCRSIGHLTSAPQDDGNSSSPVRPTTAPAGGRTRQQAGQAAAQASSSARQVEGQPTHATPCRLSRLPAMSPCQQLSLSKQGAPPSRRPGTVEAARVWKAQPASHTARVDAPAGGRQGRAPCHGPQACQAGSRAGCHHTPWQHTSTCTGQHCVTGRQLPGRGGPAWPATLQGLRPLQEAGQAGHPPQPRGLRAPRAGQADTAHHSRGLTARHHDSPPPRSQQQTTRRHEHARHSPPPAWQRAHLSALRRQPALPRRASYLQQWSVGKGRAGSGSRAAQARG